MSHTPDSDDLRRKLAEAFDQPIDPLADAESVFVELDIDSFVIFISEVLEPRDLAPSTYRHFEMLFEEWRAHMGDQGRHPACPNAEHVEAYIEWQTAPEEWGRKNNANRTVKEKLRKLNQAYRYWQQDPAFLHPEGYNPIDLARNRVPFPSRRRKNTVESPFLSFGRWWGR